jgi:AcrR family transcriptional regulator
LYRRIGHKKTTVADIARDMSMSPANVYRYFPSKQAIEEAIAGEMLDEVILAACDEARRDGSATERLRAVLQVVERLHVSRCVDDHRLHELVIIAVRESWPVVRGYFDRLNSTVAQVISDGQAQGEFFDADPVIVASCVLGATSAYLDPLLIMSGSNVGRPTLDQVTDFCIGALGAIRKKP